MSDRLPELLRQRALLLEHLAWLDREIAGMTALSPTANPPVAPAAPVPPTPPQPLAALPSSRITSATPEAAPSTELQPATDEILEKYRVEPAALQSDVRKGCFLYFVGAFVVLGIVIAILYFAISRPGG
jgi:hypothetical protein